MSPARADARDRDGRELKGKGNGGKLEAGSNGTQGGLTALWQRRDAAVYAARANA